MTAFTRQLVHTCAIERVQQDRDDIGGLRDTWVDYLSGQPCRYVEKEEKYADETVGLITQVIPRLLLSTGLTINSVTDRVKDITVEDGSTIGPFNILEVLTRRGPKGQNHISLKLEKIS